MQAELELQLSPPPHLFVSFSVRACDGDNDVVALLETSSQKLVDKDKERSSSKLQLPAMIAAMSWLSDGAAIAGHLP